MRNRDVHRVLLLAVPLLLISVGSVILADASSSTSDESVPALKQRIKELELEVERQGLLINRLRTQLEQLHRSAQLQKRLQPEELPRGARPFEFEGMQFYVIPVPGERPSKN